MKTASFKGPENPAMMLPERCLPLTTDLASCSPGSPKMQELLTKAAHRHKLSYQTPNAKKLP
jgi:hypothetical protein